LAEGNGELMETVDDKREEFMGVVQEKYGQAVEKVQEVADNLAEKKDQATQIVGDRLGEYGNKMYETGKKLPANVNETISRHPLMTVLALVGLVVIFGFLLKTSRQ
jgi:hypothetical protein